MEWIHEITKRVDDLKVKATQATIGSFIGTEKEYKKASENGEILNGMLVILTRKE